MHAEKSSSNISYDKYNYSQRVGIRTNSANTYCIVKCLVVVQSRCKRFDFVKFTHVHATTSESGVKKISRIGGFKPGVVSWFNLRL